jgi:GT2 family glycosyltransferase/glycosyltransferase involved in cell wall biosynthesis
MRSFLEGAWRVLRDLPPALLAAPILAISALALLIADLVSTFLPAKPAPRDRRPATGAASIVIPNWNGRELLEAHLPPVIAAAEAESEIIVVDNASTDGSAAFVREHFPQVQVLALDRNLGFGGGSNAGVRAARHDIVVLLNNDMRVERGFLQPLLQGFEDQNVFAVSSQIYFSDEAKLREETGLTEGWWSQGGLRVRHRADPEVREPYPCFYGGGGSCAFDRRKFLELGGFDALFHPFYLEDTDLGYGAWKRGWKVLYQPASVVHHLHRGTIGRKYTPGYIEGVLKKNYLLFTWKNVHDWRMLASHFVFTWAAAMASWVTHSPERTSPGAVVRAFLSLPRAMVSRSRAIRLARVSDREAFRRPLGGYFRDTFQKLAARPERLGVLFVSPYPMCPPVHGGAVFMIQTVRELAKLCDVHLIVLLDYERERQAHEELDRICASTSYMVRMEGRQKALGSLEPHAVREFRNADLAWEIHRQIHTRRIDVVQLEYMVLGQYSGRFRQIPSILFEHDIYFQSVARRLRFLTPGQRVAGCWEYLRSLRYELRLMGRPDRVQVCSRANAEYLLSFRPKLRGRIDDGLRAGIDTSRYDFQADGREPFTLLFLGSFRHLPNLEALNWFAGSVFPLVRQGEPRARLVVVGSDPPPRYSLRNAEGIEMVGLVEDVREPLRRHAVFLCPILSGSGVRVKLLEAFAAGIPVVSTRLGAEGLTEADGEICALADDAEAFAERVVELLEEPGRAQALARRARAYVEERHDIQGMTRRLVEGYREQVARMRGGGG